MRANFVPDPRLAPWRKKSVEKTVDVPIPFAQAQCDDTQHLPFIRVNCGDPALRARMLRKYHEYVGRRADRDTLAKRYIIVLVLKAMGADVPKLPVPDDCPSSTLFSAYKVIRSYAEEDGKSVSGGTGFA